MRHYVTERDKQLIQQSSINYKYRLYMISAENNAIIETLDNCIESLSDYNIDSESEVRRTVNIVLDMTNIVSNSADNVVSTYAFISKYRLEIGIEDIFSGEYIWYPLGTYVATNISTVFDGTSSIMNLELSDSYALLTEARNGISPGIIGTSVISIPNTDSSGNKITIQQAAIGVMDLANITKYIIQNIGEFYGMEEYNPDYETYRIENPSWNQLPYDLEFSTGTYVSEVFAEIRDLYPNCESYFDVYNNFCFNMIPSCTSDPITIDDDFIQSILLSENTENISYDISSIRNVTEVYGKVYEPDYYSTAAEYVQSSQYLNLTVSNYQAYNIGDIIAYTQPIININYPYLHVKINSLDAIDIAEEESKTLGYKTYLYQNHHSGTIMCLKIGFLNGKYVAYYMGVEYQPHAVCVLTNSLTPRDLFYDRSLSNVSVRQDPNSSFTVEKIGMICETLSGDNFDNITSYSQATANAIYYNQRSSTMQESITIVTKLIPWLDVNIKVSYKSKLSSEVREYIVKSVRNDLSEMTSTIEMYYFTPLYDNDAQTWPDDE